MEIKAKHAASPLDATGKLMCVVKYAAHYAVKALVF